MDKLTIKTKRKRNNDDESAVDDEQSSKAMKVDHRSLLWKKISGDNLNCDYLILFARKKADDILSECERTIQYNTGDLTKVKVFGKWHDIPRKQVAYGDKGLRYSFSGNVVPARPWTPLLLEIKNSIAEATGFVANFVLINRYKDGTDHIGEHRDDERELEYRASIASLSLGQPRDFVFKHADTRGKNPTKKLNPVKIQLEHGSLLMMNYPTNTYWYHSLPPRKTARGVRINMTFRKMDPAKQAPLQEK